LERIQAIGEELEKIDIQGHPQIRARLIALVEEFKDVFSSSVVKEPANVTPFSLVIDEEKWHLPRNRGRGRPTDREREHELQRLLRVLEEFDVIEPCSESHWSHAFLVPNAKAGAGHHGVMHSSMGNMMHSRSSHSSRGGYYKSAAAAVP